MKTKLFCLISVLVFCGCDVVIKPTVNNPSLTIVDPKPIQSSLSGTSITTVEVNQDTSGPVANPGFSFNHSRPDREIVYESRGSWSFAPWKSMIAQAFTLSEDAHVCQIGIGVFAFMSTNQFIPQALVITSDDVLSGELLADTLIYTGVSDGDSFLEFWHTKDDGIGVAYDICNGSLPQGYTKPLYLKAGVTYFVVVSMQTIASLKGNEVFWLAK